MKVIWSHIMLIVLTVMIILVWSLYINPDCRLESPAQAVLPMLE